MESENKIVKTLEKIETLLTMQTFQFIELNGLLKKLNYISGGTPTMTIEEIKREMDFLREYVECITSKGTLCPISGLARKYGKKLSQTLEEGEGDKNE